MRMLLIKRHIWYNEYFYVLRADADYYANLARFDCRYIFSSRNRLLLLAEAQAFRAEMMAASKTFEASLYRSYGMPRGGIIFGYSVWSASRNNCGSQPPVKAMRRSPSLLAGRRAFPRQALKVGHSIVRAKFHLNCESIAARPIRLMLDHFR